MIKCNYCDNLIWEGKGVGPLGLYCRVECWFQSSADAYQLAHDALMALEHPVSAPGIARLTEELEAEWCGCDEVHAPDCVLSVFAPAAPGAGGEKG